MKQNELRLFCLTGPIFIDAFCNILIGNIDMLMLSHYSESAVAGVALATQISTILIIILEFMAIGAGILVAQMLGRQQHADAAIVAKTAIVLNAGIGFLLTILVFTTSTYILTLFNISGEAYSFGNQYLKIVSFSFLFQGVSIAINTIMRNYGFAQIGMYVIVGMNIINVLGNSIALHGNRIGLPQTGVIGVAIVTCISKIIAMLFFVYLFKRKLMLQAHFRNFLNATARIIKIGLPNAGERLSYDFSQILITYFVTFFGVTAVTTKVITQNLMLLIMIFSYSMGEATQILVGHFVGGKNYQRAYKQALFSLKIAALVSLLIAFIFWIGSDFLFSLFTSNGQIITMGKILIFLSMFLEPGRSFNFIMSNSLKATGDIKFPTVLGVISMWGVCVPVAFILGNIYKWGLIGIWVAFILDEWLRGVILLIRWKKRRWVNNKLLTADT